MASEKKDRTNLADEILKAKVLDGVTDISTILAAYKLTENEQFAAENFARRIDEYMVANPACVARARGEEPQPTSKDRQVGRYVMLALGFALGGGIGYALTKKVGAAVASGILAGSSTAIIEETFGPMAKYVMAHPGQPGWSSAMNVYQARRDLEHKIRHSDAATE